MRKTAQLITPFHGIVCSEHKNCGLQTALHSSDGELVSGYGYFLKMQVKRISVGALEIKNRKVVQWSYNQFQYMMTCSRLSESDC